MKSQDLGLYDEKVKIAIVGSGSIAQRYVDILDNLSGNDLFLISDYQPIAFQKYRMTSRVDAIREFEGKFNIFDALIIASENINHISDFRSFSTLARNTLIEKPLFHRPLNSFEFAELDEYDGNLRISSPLRFHEAFVYTKKMMEHVGAINHIEVRCQSWLPDWRIARDFRSGFWNDPNQGGVLREIVHELDYLELLFGPLFPEWATSTFSKNLELEVESGITTILRTTENIQIDVRLDFCTRMPRRYLRIDGDSGTLIWDLINGKFEISGTSFSEKKEFSRDLDRNETFRRQISNLLQPDSWNISGTSLLEAVHALELIEEIYGLTEINSSKDVRIKR